MATARGIRVSRAAGVAHTYGDAAKAARAQLDEREELSSVEATQALERWFLPPRLTLADVSVTREGRWIVVTFKFWKAPWAVRTVKISRAWAQVVVGRLLTVLEL